MTYQDYVLRQIAMFATVLSRILGLTRRGYHEEALDTIEATLQTLSGDDPDSPDAATGAVLRAFPAAMTTFDWQEKSLMTARLLREAGAIHTELGEAAEGYACSVRALGLVLDVSLSARDIVLPDYAPTIDGLRADLSSYALPDATAELLLRYYEQTGAYAKAEDVLFDLLDASEDPGFAHDLGIAFFRRLLGRSDPELEAGGLSRDEIQAGLDDLAQCASSTIRAPARGSGSRSSRLAQRLRLWHTPCL